MFANYRWFRLLRTLVYDMFYFITVNYEQAEVFLIPSCIRVHECRRYEVAHLSDGDSRNCILKQRREVGIKVVSFWVDPHGAQQITTFINTKSLKLAAKHVGNEFSDWSMNSSHITFNVLNREMYF